MKKAYAIYDIEEYRKKYEKTTDTVLNDCGWSQGPDDRPRFSANIVMTTPDDDVPSDRQQKFLVTIEPIKLPNTQYDNDAVKRFILDRIAKDEAADSTVKTGRKFKVE